MATTSAEYVNFDEIESFCNSMDHTAEKMNSTFSEIVEAIESLKSAWIGTAAESYVNDMNELMRNFEPAHKELVSSVLFLAMVGEGYKNLSDAESEHLQSIVSTTGYFIPLANAHKKIANATSSFSEQLENVEPVVTNSEEVKQEEPIISEKKAVDSAEYASDKREEGNHAEPNNQTDKKSIDKVAKDVIYGKYGNDKNRKTRLEEAGYDYEEVQKRVNEMMRGD